MSNGQKDIIRRSASLFNRAAAAFYNYPKQENGFVPEDKKVMKNYNRNRPYGPAPRLCYAPFSSIFFNTEGKAIVCCKNTKVVLGSYPSNSLHELWFSDQAALLRDYISHNDLSYGCYKCREAMHSGNYGSMTAAGFDFLRAFPTSEYPRLLEFELSNTCNLECAMCSGRVSSAIRKNREHQDPLKMPYDSAFVEQLGTFIPHLKRARFSGGEPFLIDIYFDIWEKMIHLNPAVNLYVLTNCTILNDRVKCLLNKGNFTINVSIDSFQEETYEKIRVNAVFEKTMENLRFFNDFMLQKKKKLTLFITPTRLNWPEIPAMIEQCNAWKMEVYFSPAYYPENLSLWNLPSESLEEIIEKFQSARLPENINRRRLEELTENISFWLSEQKKDPEYINTFLHFAAQQEFCPEYNKTEIKLADAGLYREMLLANFQLAISDNGLKLNPDEIPAILSKIDAMIVRADLLPAVIYYFLKDTEPTAILTRLQSSTDEKNEDLLKLKQQEYINSHNIC